MAAYAIDFLAISVLALLVVVLFAGSGTLASWIVEQFRELLALIPEPGEPPDVERIRTFVLVSVVVALTLQLGVELLYFAFFERVWRGQSPGKRLLKLRVVSDDGGGVSANQSVTRNLLRVADILPAQYIVGLASMLSSTSGKRLGDWAAGTIVIRLDRPAGAAAIDDEPMPGDETFVFDAQQLRTMGRVELTLLRRALRQADDADSEARARILEKATTALASRMGYSAPVAPGQQRAFLRALHRAVTLHR